MKYYNSLSRKLEDFSPINKDSVKLYVCGPTVYDRIHIGNARTLIFFDLLFRFLKFNFKEVIFVRNITDVDDKIIKRAKEKNIKIQELTHKNIEYFNKDLKYLNCLPPSFEPKVTDNIDEIVNFIEILINNGSAYIVEDKDQKKHIFFNSSKFSDYGILSKRTTDNIDNSKKDDLKKHQSDFALWKPVNKNEVGWDKLKSGEDIPFGKGKPGWHIECSAIANKFLGSDFDIHGGGIDLMFPHHENEIAQSMSAYPNSKFSRFWIHNGLLTINGEKMSKSIGNIINITQLKDKFGDVYINKILRFFFFSSNYRKNVDWNEKSINNTINNLTYILGAIKDYQYDYKSDSDSKILFKKTIEPLYEDMDTPKLISNLKSLAKKIYKDPDNNLLQHTLVKVLILIGVLNNKEKIIKINVSSPNIGNLKRKKRIRHIRPKPKTVTITPHKEDASAQGNKLSKDKPKKKVTNVMFDKTWKLYKKIKSKVKSKLLKNKSKLNKNNTKQNKLESNSTRNKQIYKININSILNKYKIRHKKHYKTNQLWTSKVKTINQLLDDLKKNREEKNWEKADELRNLIVKKGYKLSYDKQGEIIVNVNIQKK